jgi:hypothetical protein
LRGQILFLFALLKLTVDYGTLLIGAEGTEEAPGGPPAAEINNRV